jgi:hypothetical protein
MFPTTNPSDEYAIIVLEIMDEELKSFYGGIYMI